jgi:hypothetical protein
MINFQNISLFRKVIIGLSIFMAFIILNCAKRSNTNFVSDIKVQYYKDKGNNSIDSRNGIVAFEFLHYFKNDTL